MKEEVCPLARGKRIHQVILADTQQLFRRGLRSLLSAEVDIEIVGEVLSMEELTTRLDPPPDVIIVDVLLLRDADESQFLRLRQAQASTHMLFLSKDDVPEMLELAMKAGGKAYMLKSCASVELIKGIRRVAAGDERTQLESTADLKALADSGRRYSRTDVLTNREQEILRLIAEGRTVRETAAELSLSIKTVEAHKLNLMRKLNIHTRATLVEYAVENGFIPAQMPV